MTLRKADDEHKVLAQTRQHMKGEPRCLWGLGLIPTDWGHAVHTKDYHEECKVEDANRWDEGREVRKVGTDGGCTTKGVIKASCGIVDDTGSILHAAPVKGNRQSARKPMMERTMPVH